MRCGSGVEMVQHILFGCFFVRSVWWAIFTWLKLLMAGHLSSVQEVLGSLDMNESKVWKKAIGEILQVAALEI
ncbi:hypothetical protein HanRHA438_Chr15g0713471 [Helianthus annuus]|nr:hypothetical protein HanRHA438_Chr15g0713471 [Helianthus annuus]